MPHKVRNAKGKCSIGRLSVKEAWLIRHRTHFVAGCRTWKGLIFVVGMSANPLDKGLDFGCHCTLPPAIAESCADSKPQMCKCVSCGECSVRMQLRLNLRSHACDQFTNSQDLLWRHCGTTLPVVSHAASTL